jgi:hypothetical protein
VLGLRLVDEPEPLQRLDRRRSLARLGPRRAEQVNTS